MSESILPEKFASLEPYAAKWALADFNDRYNTRLATSMEDMEAFYDAVMSKYREVMDYLNEFELEKMPAKELKLLQMYYSLVQVSFAVEVWKQPRVPDSGAAYLESFIAPKV